MDPLTAFYILAAFFAGGLIKGATGAGVPLIVVPVISALYDVPTAVAIFALPSLFSNIWQWWQYRNHQNTGTFAYIFAGAGLVGTAVGSVGLALIPSTVLSLGLSMIVFIYLIFIRLKPEWSLTRKTAQKMAPVVGFLSGIMQGSAGISAPLSITFLHALKLQRQEFIAVVSIFFVAMTISQIPMLIGLEILTTERALYGVMGTIFLFISMPIGNRCASKVSRETFDKLLQLIMVVMASSLMIKVMMETMVS